MDKDERCFDAFKKVQKARNSEQKSYGRYIVATAAELSLSLSENEKKKDRNYFQKNESTAYTVL